VKKKMQLLEAQAIGSQITMGKLHFYHRQPYELVRRSALSWEAEDERFLWAQRCAINELTALHSRASAYLGEEDATIFTIHAMLLEDEDLTRRVRRMIREEGVTAQFAIHTVGEQVMDTFARMESPYMQARAADIQDITRRMILRLLNIYPDFSLGDQATILVSDSFLPSEVVEMDRRRILGLITTGGSVDSHTAQILRHCGIPTMVGVEMDPLWEGRTVLMDGHTGYIYLDPTVELTERLRLNYERNGCPEAAMA